MTDGGTDLRIEQFRIRNYRVLRDVVLKDITALTVLCGPNGSGKSTVIDVFAFLHTAFTTNLRRAWDERNRLAEIRSRGQEGAVGIEIKYRTNLDGTSRLATYSLDLGESRGMPVVQTERLRWTIAPGSGKPKVILDFSHGQGHVFDEDTGETRSEKLSQSDSLAVSALGQLSRHPRVTALRDFIFGWYLSYEAWFMGDVDARRAAYPRVPQSLAARQKFRMPADVRGGTWEALEELLQSYGYHDGGLRKIALADDVARHMDVERNRSGSFCCLRDGLRSLTSRKATV